MSESQALTAPLRFCRICRQVIRGPGTCPHELSKTPLISGGMRAKAILDLSNPTDRSVLVETVWPEPVTSLAGTFGPLALGLFCVWGLIANPLESGGDLLAAFVQLSLGPALLIRGALSAGPAFRNLRAKLTRKRTAKTLTAARGASSTPLLPPATGDRIDGTVQGGPRLWAPATARSCVAWALALRSHEHTEGPLLLRDAANIAFEVVTEGGQRVRIPAGQLRLPEAATPCPSATQASVETYLATVDPQRTVALKGVGLHSDPFPWTEAREDIIAIGDRVRLSGPFVEKANLSAAERGYRDGAETILVAEGIVTAERLSTSRRERPSSASPMPRSGRCSPPMSGAANGCGE